MLILMHQYSPQAVLRINHSCTNFASPDPVPQTRILIGHLPSGVHGFGQPPTYVTLIGEPLERTLSHCSHWARANTRPLLLGEYLFLLPNHP